MTPMKTPTLPILLLITGLFLCKASSGQEFACPSNASIKPGTTELSEIPAGFEARISHEPIRLSYIALYNGPPQEMGELKPNKSDKKSSTWIFEGPYPGGKWISCEYGDGIIKIYTKVSDTAKECIASTQRKTGSTRIQASVSCR
jgi:hypothetical protein